MKIGDLIQMISSRAAGSGFLFTVGLVVGRQGPKPILWEVLWQDGDISWEYDKHVVPIDRDLSIARGD